MRHRLQGFLLADLPVSQSIALRGAIDDSTDVDQCALVASGVECSPICLHWALCPQGADGL